MLFAKKYLDDLHHKEEKLDAIVSNYQSKLLSSTEDDQESSSQIQGFVDVFLNNHWEMEMRPYSSLEVLRTDIHILKVVETI